MIARNYVRPADFPCHSGRRATLAHVAASQPLARSSERGPGTRHGRTWANQAQADRASEGLTLFVERTIPVKSSTSTTACPNAIIFEFVHVFMSTLPVHWINGINAIAAILFYCAA